jgi:hypothetical protein
VPTNHPLRKIRQLVREVLGELNRSLGKLYASEGRPSIPPEQLLSGKHPVSAAGTMPWENRRSEAITKADLLQRMQ